MLQRPDVFRFKEEVQTAYEKLPHPIAIFHILDNLFVPIVVSDGFCEMFGYDSRAEAYEQLDKYVFSNIHPDDVARLESEVHKTLTESGNYEIIYRAKTKDRSGYKVVRAVGKHICDENDVHLVHVMYADESEDVNRKISELQESVSSLLTNMPAMTFSKDLNTRKYIACNQAFADYCHKETPEGVVGLTDFDIFDYDTAKHFVDDDKKAIVMNVPYIFFEDVPDAAGNPRRFQTTKLKFVDATGRACLLGLCQDVTDAMLIKQDYDQRLAQANNQANIDELTGIKNKHAYALKEEQMNLLIRDHKQPDFAVTIFDVNDLKKINDTLGHQAGDEFICKACKTICDFYKRSPVFRIGGDEFAVISESEDYDNLEELEASFDKYNEDAQRTGGIVIAYGMAKYEGESSVEEVFTKADKNMYEHKKQTKKA